MPLSLFSVKSVSASFTFVVEEENLFDDSFKDNQQRIHRLGRICELLNIKTLIVNFFLISSIVSNLRGTIFKIKLI